MVDKGRKLFCGILVVHPIYIHIRRQLQDSISSPNYCHLGNLELGCRLSVRIKCYNHKSACLCQCSMMLRRVLIMRRSKSSEHYTHKEYKWCNKGEKKILAIPSCCRPSRHSSRLCMCQLKLLYKKIISIDWFIVQARLDVFISLPTKCVRSHFYKCEILL